MEGIFISISLFGFTAAVLIVYLVNRNRERMAMIEKGVSLSELRGSADAQSKAYPLSSLKWGLLAFFVGLGLVVANILESSYYIHDSIYFASMLLFGGVGLVLFYRIASRKID